MFRLIFDCCTDIIFNKNTYIKLNYSAVVYGAQISGFFKTSCPAIRYIFCPERPGQKDAATIGAKRHFFYLLRTLAKKIMQQIIISKQILDFQKRKQKFII